MGQLTYTTAEVEDTARKTLEPSILSTYRPLADPLTTPSITAATPTKVLVTNTERKVNGFTLDAPNTRYYLSESGVVDREFSVSFSTSVEWNGGGTATLNVELYVNGVLDPSVGITTKFANNDVEVMAIGGTVELSTNDYTEIFLTTDSTGTFTFYNSSVLLLEVN